MRLDLPELGSGGGGVYASFVRDETPAPSPPAREGRLYEETIAGYILYRLQEGTVEYLLLKKVHQNDWSPPKGHIENNEECFEGARREVVEETGLTFADYDPLEQYPIYFEYKTRQQILKKVHLWAARYLNLEKPVSLSEEHDEFQWLDYEAAIAVVKRQYKEALMAADLVVRTFESL